MHYLQQVEIQLGLNNILLEGLKENWVIARENSRAEAKFSIHLKMAFLLNDSQSKLRGLQNGILGSSQYVCCLSLKKK
jgi:hypothetical protein